MLRDNGEPGATKGDHPSSLEAALLCEVHNYCGQSASRSPAPGFGNVTMRKRCRIGAGNGSRVVGGRDIRDLQQIECGLQWPQPNSCAADEIGERKVDGVDGVGELRDQAPRTSRSGGTSSSGKAMLMALVRGPIISFKLDVRHLILAQASDDQLVVGNGIRGRQAWPPRELGRRRGLRFPLVAARFLLSHLPLDGGLGGSDPAFAMRMPMMAAFDAARTCLDGRSVLAGSAAQPITNCSISQQACSSALVVAISLKASSNAFPTRRCSSNRLTPRGSGGHSSRRLSASLRKAGSL